MPAYIHNKKLPRIDPRRGQEQLRQLFWSLYSDDPKKMQACMKTIIGTTEVHTPEPGRDERRHSQSYQRFAFEFFVLFYLDQQFFSRYINNYYLRTLAVLCLYHLSQWCAVLTSINRINRQSSIFFGLTNQTNSHRFHQDYPKDTLRKIAPFDDEKAYLIEVIMSYLGVEWSVNNDAIQEYRCQISHELTLDPVAIAHDSNSKPTTYCSRKQIETWIGKTNITTNPVTGKPFSIKFLNTLKENPDSLIDQDAVSEIIHQINHHLDEHQKNIFEQPIATKP